MAEGERRQASRKGGIAFLGVTGLLVLVCAALAYMGYGREAPVRQNVVEGPPQQPTEAQRQAASKALLAVGVMEERLRTTLAAMDPPNCPPGAVLDQAKLGEARAASKPDIDKWQALLASSAPIQP
ncbi:hypothetical protein SAMN07250955_101506 [Arboricoccus pini]|uniref:Uncharacterized protein n=1 Tax=Arboricoccus pini TaxID=1963835 RepID=A0A212Q946_9PROT|nr:hypothetical protein [Arboricoccus pini]SNB55891.1 hypothetical protein SAMN07250955_101506 [Arboricoccus pini]